MDYSETLIYHVADFFKIFGDATRIRILAALLKENYCVNHLADVVKMSQSAVSHQLRILRQHHIVKYKKEGKTVVYSLDDCHVGALLQQGFEHIMHLYGDDST